MKFVTYNRSAKTNLLILLVATIVLLTGLQAKNLSMPSILDRISAGDLKEKEIFEIYTKNYKPEIEYHQIFQPCLEHLVTQKNISKSTVLNKILFGFEKLVSNPSQMDIRELGLKVDCEVYITKIISNEFREKKLKESNPLNEILMEQKIKIQNLKEKYDNLAHHSLIQRSENKSKKSAVYFSSKNSAEKEEGAGDTNSSTSKTTTTTSASTVSLNIDSRTPTYNLVGYSDSDSDSSYTALIATMKTQIQSGSERYSKLEIQYEKVVRDYSLLKVESGTEKGKSCDCDSKLKTCNYDIIQKDSKILQLSNTIIELNTQITILQNNPPQGKCDDLTLELKKQIEENKKCKTEVSQITNKYTQVNSQLTIITLKYDTLLAQIKGMTDKNDACNINITLLEKKITIIEKKNNETILNLKIQITNLKVEIKNYKEQITKLTIECKKNPKLPETPGGDILIKHQLDLCLIRENNLQINIKSRDTTIINITFDLSNRDKEIVDLRVQINKYILEITNLKNSYEKIINELNITITDFSNKYNILFSENRTLYIYKTKYEKCTGKCDKDIKEFKLKIQTLEIKINSLTIQLKECHRSESSLKIEITNKITIINRLTIENEQCEKKRIFCDSQLTIKITEITTIIEKHTKEIIVIKGKFNERCEQEKALLIIQIESLKRQISSLSISIDCPSKLKTCESINNRKDITITEINTIIVELKLKITTCNDELDKEKGNSITINNQINILNIKIEKITIDLNNCNKGRNNKICDETKYNILLKKYTDISYTYDITNQNWFKCKITNMELQTEIDNLKKRKCDESCENNLKICETKVINITNNYNTQIEIKITEINQLTIKIGQMQKGCGDDLINIELKLKTCEKNNYHIRHKYDLCEFDLKNEISIRKTYYNELIFLRKEFKNCTKQATCKQDEVKLFQRVHEKCEEQKLSITKHLDSLKEKLGKLHTEKVSFFSQSNNMLETLSKQCSIDSTTLTKFMSTFDISITELTNFKQSIISDVKKDEIDENKDKGFIELKQVEIKRTSLSIKEIKIEITKTNKDIQEILIKLRVETNIKEIQKLIATLDDYEKKLKNKNELILSFVDRLSKAESSLKILQESIKNTERLKTFRNAKYTEINNIYTNVEKTTVEIKKYIDIKKESSKTVDVKVKKYKGTDMPLNPLVAILKGEKDNINNKIKVTEENNLKLEKQVIELNKKLVTVNMNNCKTMDITTSFSDGSIMSVFENKDFVMNNCGKVNEFTMKLNSMCKSSNPKITKFKKIGKDTYLKPAIPTKPVVIPAIQVVKPIETPVVVVNPPTNNVNPKVTEHKNGKEIKKTIVELKKKSDIKADLKNKVKTAITNIKQKPIQPKPQVNTAMVVESQKILEIDSNKPMEVESQKILEIDSNKSIGLTPIFTGNWKV